MALSRYLPDPFVQSLAGTVLLASLLPASGSLAAALKVMSTLAIGLLFFLHGARLSRASIVAGLSHWRLHAVVLGGTFVLFPLAGWLLRPLLVPWLGESLYQGVLFLCILPSTVQSAIAMTSLARGNVSAAVCGASLSTLLGIFLTPVLAGWLLHAAASTGGPDPLGTVVRLFAQLFLPFVCGHLLSPVIGAWLKPRAWVYKAVDRGGILLTVYVSFSAAVLQGLWSSITLGTLVALVVSCFVLLALGALAMVAATRAAGMPREDEVTAVFGGTTKSLISGVPIAGVLFPPSVAGPMLLPVMVFHQLQLVAGSALAQRYASRPVVPAAASPGLGREAP